MKKTGIFYGSSSGVTGEIADKLAAKLGADVYDVAETSVDTVQGYELLILGSSTWGAGDLQDDWEDFLPKLKKQDLSGKAVALFGTGDASSFGDTFCDAVGTIWAALQGTGCTFCGKIPADGYSYDASTAEVDGSLVGLLLDEVNEDDQTAGRIDHWVEQLKKEN